MKLASPLDPMDGISVALRGGGCDSVDQTTGHPVATAPHLISPITTVQASFV